MVIVLTNPLYASTKPISNFYSHRIHITAVSKTNIKIQFQQHRTTLPAVRQYEKAPPPPKKENFTDCN